MSIAAAIIGIMILYMTCFGVLSVLIHRRLRHRIAGLDDFGYATLMLAASYVLQLAFPGTGAGPASLLDHSLSAFGPLILLVGLRRFLAMPVPAWRTLLLMAGAYTVAQVGIVFLLGPAARFLLLSASAIVVFVLMSWSMWQGAARNGRDVRVALLIVAVISLGFAGQHAVKAGFVLRDGVAALDLDRWHQTVFYAYMAGTAVVLVPLLMWMVFQRLTAALEAAAVHDPLTGVLNRRGMQQRLEEHLAGRNTRGACLLLLDVDHFKAINDSHGHQVGDEVLVRLAQLLAEGVRKGDFVARTGGEEFTVGCLDADVQAAAVLAARLQAQVAATPHPLPNRQPARYCTVSIGVSRQFRDIGQLDEALHQADAALYGSKRGGRNRTMLAPVEDAV